MDQFKQTLSAFARKPVVAAALSFLFPGLGQAAAGQRNRAAIVAIPMLAMLAALLLAALIEGKSILNSAFNQAWLTSLLIVDLVALIYHAWAVVDAYRVAGKAQAAQRRGRSNRGGAAATLGVILIVSSTVAVHAGLASVDMSWQGSVSCFGGLVPCFANTSLAPDQTIAITTDPPDIGAGDSASGSTGPTPTPGAGGTFDPSSLPSFPTTQNSKDWAADGQLNILLVGIDSGAGGGRNQGLRPDSMNVLHMDIKTGRAAMIGVPRNTMCVPLPDGPAQHYSKAKSGCPAYTWPYMLNWLANDAGWNNKSFYGGDQSSAAAYTRAMTATMQAVDTLTGLKASGHQSMASRSSISWVW